MTGMTHFSTYGEFEKKHNITDTFVFSPVYGQLESPSYASYASWSGCELIHDWRVSVRRVPRAEKSVAN